MPMECITASAPFRNGLYVEGLSISAFSQETLVDHAGGLGDEVTKDHDGSPEREIDVTFQPLATATRQMRDPATYLVERGWKKA